ncbi:MAG TPA: N-acetylmuramoyl-L-alanine amidase [Methylomirabilota bacterium]|nr:N-acetylmuramoyl-L-alanine amidase [Methylomirabilota bacterium]
MMRRPTTAVLLWMLMGLLVGSAQAARPESVEVKDGAGNRGVLPITVTDDGGAYVSPDRLAAMLKGAWLVKGNRATLTIGKHTAEFVRGQSSTRVAGQTIVLDSAARVVGNSWLVSRDFLGKGLPRLSPGVSVAAVSETRKPQTRTVQGSVPLEELRYRSYPSFTRVVIETGAKLAYAVVSSEAEVRVRLPGLSLSGSRVEEIGDGLVQEVRLEPVDGVAVLRVILEGTAGEVKHATLLDPYRLVLDVYRPREPGSEPGRSGQMQPLKLIVLDAGHGGHDTGAVGPSGLMEKEIVLDVTRRVARMVESGLGVKVVMSRDSDVFVPLRERTNFANKQRADLFVSIHANAHPQAVSEGVETYFLSSEASDNAARQVAAVENGVVQLESSGGTRQRGDMLKSILWDLAQSEFQEESSFMAETVQDSMSKSLSLVNRGVKQAGFYVLGGAAMPAILIEIGFLTNRKEEKKLGTAEHREALARAIYAGLAEYKRRYDQRMRTAQTAPPRSVPPNLPAR